MRNHLGFFTIEQRSLLLKPEIFLPLFANMVVLKAENTWTDDGKPSVTYLAMCPDFREIRGGERIPGYVLYCDDCSFDDYAFEELPASISEQELYYKR